MFRVLLNDADGSIERNEGFSARMTYAERISFPGALRWVKSAVMAVGRSLAVFPH
jgi:hypothetical protein